MEGRLGGLFSESEQVGGILDWKFEVIFTQFPDANHHIVYKFSKWILTVSSYWLFKEVGSVIVRLYNGDRYWEGEGNINNIPTKVYDTLIHKPIEIVGESQLVEKK